MGVGASGALPFHAETAAGRDFGTSVWATTRLEVASHLGGSPFGARRTQLSSRA